MEFSIYIAPENAEQDSPDLLQQSLFLGSCNKIFTHQNFQKLKYQEVITETLLLSKIPSKYENSDSEHQIGQITFDLKLNMGNLQEQLLYSN